MTTIRALVATDDRSTFQSGDVELDRFFASYAGQNQFKNYIGVSYVAVDDAGRIVGFATVAPASIEIERLPVALRKKLPSYPLPVLRLARLATDEAAKGQGIGSSLLKYVFLLALRMADELGCVGILVDAYPTAISFYKQFGFFELELLEGESGARPQPVAMYISLREVKAAKG